MITYLQQYRIISKVWQSFKNGKLSEKVRISESEIERAKRHYRPERFENFTLDNFKALLVYIMYKYSPSSKTDFICQINLSDKDIQMESLKFRNKMINTQNTLRHDLSIIKTIDSSQYNNIHDLYKDGRISVISLYSYYKLNPDKIKGRILKKDLKIAIVLMQMFNINEGDLNWTI